MAMGPDACDQKEKAGPSPFGAAQPSTRSCGPESRPEILPVTATVVATVIKPETVVGPEAVVVESREIIVAGSVVEIILEMVSASVAAVIEPEIIAGAEPVVTESGRTVVTGSMPRAVLETAATSVMPSTSMTATAATTATTSSQLIPVGPPRGMIRKIGMGRQAQGVRRAGQIKHRSNEYYKREGTLCVHGNSSCLNCLHREVSLTIQLFPRNGVDKALKTP